MRKIKLMFILVIGVLITTPFAFAVSPPIKVEKIDKGSVIIQELNNPAYFDFVITNDGPEDKYEIYTLVSIDVEPRGMFNLTTGRTVRSLKFYLPEDLLYREGFLSFEYEIKGFNQGILKDKMLVKIVSLQKALSVSAEPLAFEDNVAKISIKNTQNAVIENIKVRFKSDFFDETKELSFKPNEEINLTVSVNRDKAKSLLAGSYPFVAEIKVKDKTVKLENVFYYLEKEGTSVEKRVEGYVIKKTTIQKINRGNVPVTASIKIQKDIFSRLFTINSVEPEKIEREGIYVAYSWKKTIGPTEVFEVTSTTNFTIPLILIFLIVLVVVLAKIYSQTALVLQKRVSYVKTQGGELALKVTIHAKAKRNIDNVQIIDVLPHMTKLYEKFGKKPDRIDAGTRRLFWNLGKLTAGEERVYSYIIYSKVNVVGRFELPAATGIFERNSKIQEVWSNRAFFVSETGKLKEN